MTIIRFTQSYNRGLLLYNPGEEAGFIDVEAAALVQAGVAVVVRKVISAVPDPPHTPFSIRRGGQS